MKPTKRKAFNFLRSYFDVLNEIPNDKDKLQFLLAVINKQFLDEDPKDLSFIVNLSYQSQRHQIETSVKGYKSKTKDTMQAPCQGGMQAPYVQEEEEEQVKEEEQEKGKDEVNENDTSIFYDIGILKNHYLTKDKVIDAIISNKKNNVKDKKDLLSKFELFNQDLLEQARLKMNWSDYSSYFRNCLKSGKFDNKPQEMTFAEKERIQKSKIIF